MSITSDASKYAISPLIYPHPRWRYFVLFQSWQQFKSWSTITILATFILSAALEIFDPNIIPIEGLAIGAIIGSLFSVLSVIPVQFTISNSHQSDRQHLNNQLTYFGYIEDSGCANDVVFRQNLPRLLRWDEGNITVTSESRTIKVTGPMCIVKAIRHDFTKNFLT